MIATTSDSTPLSRLERSTANSTTVDMSDPTDHELMLAVRAGKIARLGELFERHHGALFGFFLRLTQQRALSEDLVQWVFYRILKYRHTYRDEGKFSAWIYHLARKVAADHYRKRPLPTSGSETNDLAELLPDQSPGPSENATHNDDLALMRQAMAELPLDQREILVLHRFQNLQHAEIARLLECNEGAVKVRAHRALVALRELYFKLRRGRLN